MTLVNISGTLSDFGLSALSPYQPRIAFTPSGAAFNEEKVLASRRIVAPINEDGSFSVAIESTWNTRPHRTFTVTVEWLESGGGGTGYNAVDVIEGFVVPPQGGSIGTIASLLFDPTQVWVSETRPSGPAISTWWLDMTTGDLYEWEL